MFTHIENDVLYRNPVGAVPDGTALEISLMAENEADIQKVYLIALYNDSEMKSYIMEKPNRTYHKTNETQEMNEKGEDTKIETYKVKLNTVKGLYFYHFEIEYSNKKEYLYKDGRESYPNNSMPKWQITVYDKNFKTPNFFKGGIMYHIFVDRFNSSGEIKVRSGFYMHEDKNDMPFYKPDADGIIRNEDVYGGNLRGIIEKLDYLKELNVSLIYLSPIFEANSNHKYNIADYTKIDDMFGDDEIFDELIEKANKRGIKIILDGVFNHTGSDSIYFNRYGTYDSVGAYQSKQSPYYDWYTFNNHPDDYDCWWGVKSVPSIKKDQPVYRAFICGVNGIIEKWIKRGAAGFRIDVADELSDRMLRGIHRAVKETSPEGIVIGEVWEDASNKISYGYRRQYLLGNQLDSVMNYPLRDAIITYLRTGNSKNMSDVMTMITGNYPKDSIDCLMNVIGTHDTVRILTSLGTANFVTEKDDMAAAKLTPVERNAGVTLLKMAVAMQMTLPGVPCIYYGDEAGMEGYGDPFCRKYFPWDNIDAEIFDFYKKITRIRKNLDVFADGEYKLIDDKDGVYCFKREKDGSAVYVCVNLSGQDYSLSGIEGGGVSFHSLLKYISIETIKSGECDIFAQD